MSTRDDVVTVLDGLELQLADGTVTISAYPVQPGTVDAWSAWTVWASTTWRTVAIADDSWTVVVALPGSDPGTVAAAADAAREPVREALMKLGGVMRCEPITLAVGDQATTVTMLAYSLET